MTPKTAIIERVEGAGEGVVIPQALKTGLQKLNMAELESLRDFVESTYFKGFDRGRDAEAAAHFED